MKRLVKMKDFIFIAFLICLCHGNSPIIPPQEWKTIHVTGPHTTVKTGCGDLKTVIRIDEPITVSQMFFLYFFTDNPF